MTLSPTAISKTINPTCVEMPLLNLGFSAAAGWCRVRSSGNYTVLPGVALPRIDEFQESQGISCLGSNLASKHTIIRIDAGVLVAGFGRYLSKTVAWTIFR